MNGRFATVYLLDQAWTALLKSRDENIPNSVWTPIIALIADAVLRSRPERYPQVDLSDEDACHEVIGKWFWESLPNSRLLYYVDRCWFEDHSNGWEEDICFSGDACPCTEDKTYDIQNYSSDPFIDEIVTEEVVLEHYFWWRSDFFDRVSKGLEELKELEEREELD